MLSNDLNHDDGGDGDVAAAYCDDNHENSWAIKILHELWTNDKPWTMTRDHSEQAKFPSSTWYKKKVDWHAMAISPDIW